MRKKVNKIEKYITGSCFLKYGLFLIIKGEK